MEIRAELYPAYLLTAVPLGIFLGIVLEPFRLLRLMRRGWLPELPDCVLTAAEDILYAVFCGICAVLHANAENCGRIRWFALAAMLAGFVLWRACVGNPLVRFFGRQKQKTKEKTRKTKTQIKESEKEKPK